MSLEALFASPKGGPNPLQKLVDHYWQAQSMRSVLSSYPQGSEIVKKLDNTRGLIDELEKLTKQVSNIKTELAKLDLTEANKTFDSLVNVDTEEGVFLQALLDFEFERTWEKVQENNKAAEEFVNEFLALEKAYTFPSLPVDTTTTHINESLNKNLQTKDNSEVSKEQIHFYGEDGHTEYENAFYEFMANVVIESSKDVKYNFDNAGSNLVFFMRCCAEPRDFERDYEAECTALRETYQVLTRRIEEIRKTTSEDTLALPINNFVRSVNIFLEAVLQSIYAKEVLLGEPQSYKSISEVSICHDCLAYTYEILTDNTVFVLGGL